MDLSITFVILLLITGFVAGVINTMAGGGSNLTLPALMILGLPADVANATNRVGVFMQSLVAARGFSKHKQLPTVDLKSILIPTLLGGLLGAVIASFIPSFYLKPILLIVMISMAIVILVRPSTVIAGEDEPSRLVGESKRAWWVLFVAGIYGGFVQAGVGFVLIAAIAGGLRYSMVKTNALKVVCTLAFTSVALGVFIWRGQVMWVPGLILAVATMGGAHLGVRLALNVSQRFMKWFLLIMTIAASLAALI
jgi:uncharacterized membrane protein YfcA